MVNHALFGEEGGDALNGISFSRFLWAFFTRDVSLLNSNLRPLYFQIYNIYESNAHFFSFINYNERSHSNLDFSQISTLLLNQANERCLCSNNKDSLAKCVLQVFLLGLGFLDSDPSTKIRFYLASGAILNTLHEHLPDHHILNLRVLSEPASLYRALMRISFHILETGLSSLFITSDVSDPISSNQEHISRIHLHLRIVFEFVMRDGSFLETLIRKGHRYGFAQDLRFLVVEVPTEYYRTYRKGSFKSLSIFSSSRTFITGNSEHKLLEEKLLFALHYESSLQIKEIIAEVLTNHFGCWCTMGYSYCIIKNFHVVYNFRSEVFDDPAIIPILIDLYFDQLIAHHQTSPEVLLIPSLAIFQHSTRDLIRKYRPWTRKDTLFWLGLSGLCFIAVICLSTVSIWFIMNR